jgi:hypothetical protein
MDLTGLTVWRCPDGHVMGQVRRNGHKVQRLLLYRQAVDMTLTPDPLPGGEGGRIEEVDVMAVVEGLVMDVRCSICGGIRTWRPMEDKRRPQISRIFTDFPERG